MATINLSEQQTFNNPAWSRGCGDKSETAKQLAAYYDHGWLELDELEPQAVEPVKKAYEDRVKIWDAHYAKYGD